MLISGADEAGRGCVIGPLVICVAVIEKEKEAELKAIGVRDSKLLSPAKRSSLYKQVKKLCKESKSIHITAEELNHLMDTLSLNEIEAMKIAEAFNSLKSSPEKLIVDSPDTNPENFSERLRKYLKKQPALQSEHKADVNHPIVSAASIIAKVERDRAIEDIKKEVGEDFNSGYSSDPKTIEFLKKHLHRKDVQKYVRSKWSTLDRIGQKTLFEF